MYLACSLLVVAQSQCVKIIIINVSFTGPAQGLSGQAGQWRTLNSEGYGSIGDDFERGRYNN